MRRYYLQSGLWMSVLTLLIFGGLYVAADLNATDRPSNTLNIDGGFWSDIGTGFASDKISGRSAKIAAQNSFSLSLDANSAAGDQAVTSVNTSADQVVAIQVFGSSIQNASGFGLRFEYDASQVTYQGFDVGSVLPGSPQVLAEHGTNPTFVTIGIASFSGQATVSSGLVGTVSFLTTTGFSGTAVQLVRAELSRSGQSETVTLTARVELQVSTAPSPDFDGDGTVGISDFLQFVNHFGTSRGGAGYDAKYDLDGNDVIGISDFLIFVNNFGSQVPPSGGGGGGGGSGSPDLIVDSPSVSDNTLTTGQSFTLSATVRNQGTGSSAATTLRYYRSSNSTISTSDTEIGTDTVNGLSASGTSAESISLNAPSSAGTYYYGACVESVSGESDTGNNCSDAVSVTVATVTPPATGTSKLYWTDWGTDKIQRADLDGSNVEDLVSGTGLNGPDGLALDVSGGKMYWTNVGTNKIQRADLDGSNVEDLVTSGLSVPYGLALDVSGGKMYWTNRQTSKIQRADLDGSNVEDLLTLSGLAFPGELALDVSGGKMYWTNPGMDKIQRANLDGSNVEDLVASGLNSPTGLALDVSGGKMYWTDRGTHKIQRADLDGSNIEDLITSSLNTPTGLDLDVSGGKMYWTDVDADKVQRANLDGSNVEDLLTRSDGLVDPSGLAVGLIGTVSNAITGSITDCSATEDSSIYRIRIEGTVRAIRPVSSLILRGYVGSSFVGMVSLGSMSAGQTKSFTITGISGTEPSGGCRVNMEWREGGGKSQGVVNER